MNELNHSDFPQNISNDENTYIIKPDGQDKNEETSSENTKETPKFYGNMGEPETPQEYKNRYGVWPSGYDDNGNKL